MIKKIKVLINIIIKLIINLICDIISSSFNLGLHFKSNSNQRAIFRIRKMYLKFTFKAETLSQPNKGLYLFVLFTYRSSYHVGNVFVRSI